MTVQTPEEEAKQIMEVIGKYFPKIFRAKESIAWLHSHTNQGRQREWQGF